MREEGREGGRKEGERERMSEEGGRDEDKEEGGSSGRLTCDGGGLKRELLPAPPDLVLGAERG